MEKGKLFVISGPSGVGKGTICSRILEETGMKFSVSMTTRKPRENEEDGVNYFFVTDEEFQRVVDDGGFLEYAEVYGNRYGTPLAQTLECLEAGLDVMLDIDIQGAQNVKKMYPDGIFIFVLPPSLAELKNRIVMRGSETEETLKVRFGAAIAELKHAREYDYCVVNGDLEEAVEAMKSIWRAEHLRFSEDIFNKIDIKKGEI
ncbi:MAG: guanylate kinase [Firmicutes bacterium]|nr:guanylate kinase [Bacillota bacterium]